MRNIILVIIGIVFVFNLNASDLNRYNSRDYIVVSDSIAVSKRKKDKQDLKNKLRKRILETISYQIITSVHAETQDKVVEKRLDDNSTIESEFNSLVETKTNLKISNIEREKYWYDKKRKLFKGVIVVNKKKLAETYLLKSCNKIKGLILELENIKYYKQTGDLIGIENEYKNEEIWYFICLSLSPKYDGIKRFESLSKKFYTLLFEAKRSNEEILVQRYLSEIKVLYFNKKYSEALILSQKGLSKFPYVTSFVELQHSIEKEYEDFTLNQIKNYKNLNQYSKALESADDFLKIVPLSKSVSDEKVELKKLLFNQYLESLYIELENGNLSKSKEYLSYLEELKYIDLQKFSQARKDISKQSSVEDYYEIKISYDNKEYEKTWNLIKRYESTYKNGKDVSDIKEKTKKKLYKKDKKELRSKKPHQWALLVGVDINSRSCKAKYFFDEFDFKEPYHLSYNLTISKIIKKHYLGIQFRYLDITRRFINSDSLVSNHPNFLIGLNYIFSEVGFLDVNIPLKINGYGIKINEPNTFHLATGFILPYDNIYLKFGVQTITDFNEELNLQAYVSLKYKFNFYRKLTKADKYMIEKKYN